MSRGVNINVYIGEAGDLNGSPGSHQQTDCLFKACRTAGVVRGSFLHLLVSGLMSHAGFMCGTESAVKAVEIYGLAVSVNLEGVDDI